MLPEILKLENMGGQFARLSHIADTRVPKGLSAVSVLRITEGAKAHIATAINAVKLYITADTLAAKSVLSKINSFENGKNVYLPPRDDVLVCRGGFSLSGVRERSITLSSLDDVDTLVISADPLIQRLPKPELVEKYTVKVSKEQIVEPQALADSLSHAGYNRVDGIAEIGDFSLRGDIVDVYSVSGKAYRIDFFDELVEDIKIINLEDMTVEDECDMAVFPPASDIIIDECNVEKTKNRMLATENPIALEMADKMESGVCSPSDIWAVPFDLDDTSSVFDHIEYCAKKQGKSVVVIFDEPKVILEKINILHKEFSNRFITLSDDGEVTAEHKETLYSLSEIKRRILLHRKLSFTSLALSNPLFEPETIIEPKCRPVTKYYLDRASVKADMRNFLINGFKIIFACGSNDGAKAVRNSLLEEEVFATFSYDGNGDANIFATPLKIESGFHYPEYKVLVIGTNECVGKKHIESAILPKQQFIVPKTGDYVVHRVHGVGICEGTTIVKVGDFEKEYIVLKYRDGDKLYVATDQTDYLQKFVGEEHPHLNKLGGKEFEREKEKVRASVKKLAINLIEIYARREKQKGFKYSADTVWQKEFEDAFEYIETPDQLKAIEDIKRDMEDGKIMDRLLVGDVGFGKTEVALRAVFKTVIDAKQAVILAPTTILARQHYETLAPRLKPFGIDCALLTRLQSAKENAETMKRLEDGTLHIVVATHKVLSKSVNFHDLGLLVLDEEQRFGVEHKEKLKEKHPNLNVLTLSATPIPRTLNMALSGIRDISMLETAPAGRLPVQTYVTPYSDTLVKDAVTRECARGGQVLILLNDIEGLNPYADHIRALLPDVRIVTAHGQMAPGELETKMAAFYDKEYDVLISTTIIENGIDIPDANTLIVLNAGNFGLSQLYQLRGRVGRRGVLAHAYFTVPENGALGEIAEKRLQALLDNTEIGSGYKIALSDLSIRGAGNILGAEQHGHIEKVGYEMYIELLNEAVEELRTGKKVELKRETEMKVEAPAFIRDGYVAGRDKLRIYKRIENVSSSASRDELLKELDAVFGKVEQPLQNLVNISLLKNLAKGFDASRVIINRNGAAVNFYDSEIFKNEGLMNAVSIFASEVVLTSTIPPSLIFDVKGMTPEEKILKVINFFETA